MPTITGAGPLGIIDLEVMLPADQPQPDATVRTGYVTGAQLLQLLADNWGGGAVAADGSYTLPKATSTILGGVKDGAGVTVAGDGTLAADVLSVAGRTGTITLTSADIGGFAAAAAAAAPVASVAGRTGAITLTAADIGGFAAAAAAAAPVASVAGRTGAITIAAADLTATGTRDTTTFLRGDNTWAVPPGGAGGGAVASVAGRTGAVVLGPTDICDSANTSTGYLALPSGSTVERPAGQGAGRIRFNTTTGRHEFDTGSAWRNHLRREGDSVTGPMVYVETPLTDAATIALNSAVIANNAYLALGTAIAGNTRALGLPTGLALPSLADGSAAAAVVYPLTLTVVQPAAGGQQLTFPVAVKVVGNLDTAASAVSTVSILFRWDGTTVTGRGVITRGYA